MGPLATVKAFELFITHTKAECDNDHIPILVFGDSSVPDRTCAIMRKGPSPVPELLENIRLIEKIGVEEVFIPCNTCHYFFDELQNNTSLHLINMVKETTQYIRKKYPQRECYVLGTDGTVNGKVYERYSDSQFKYQPLCREEQTSVMNVIYQIKNSGISDDVIDIMYRLIKKKNSNNNSVFILGCTELSVIKENLQKLLPEAVFVDAMEVAVCSVIKKMKYEIKEGSTDIDVMCLSGS